jgi:hypothetical protein
MAHYNLEQEVIDDLQKINDNNTKKYYTYNGCDFYFKRYDNTDRLLVAFHGSINSQNKRQPLPVFRMYDYKYNVLCLSDKLLKLHAKLDITWYASWKGSKIFESYHDIINTVSKKFKNIVFFGSSAGGLPALKFSSIFKQKALILNSQLYILKYFDGQYTKHMLEQLNKTYDELLEPNSEKIIETYGPPALAYIYCNTRDLHIFNDHYSPFKRYIYGKKLEKHFNFIEFHGEEPVPPNTHHDVQVPKDKTRSELIGELFDKR